MCKKTVLVTGASRGIGREIALKYGKQGYNVIITCLKSQKRLNLLEKEIVKNGSQCLSFIGDMGDSGVVETLFQEIHEKFQGVDILVNNAGIAHVGLLTDMSDEMWRRIMDTNLSSAFYCSRSAIPYMVHQKSGKILNISSVWGEVGASCEVAYSASKAGLNGLTKALAKELAPSNIQVNALALGVVNTEMNECFDDEERVALEAEIPAGRFAEAKEIGEIVYNITNGNDYITGQVIAVDGGWI